MNAHASTDHVPHVLPLKSYFAVWAALLVFTALTVGVSYLDFGAWNLVIALLVASVKATMVAAVFMHLAFEKKKFNAVVFSASLVFLGIMVGFTFFDIKGRGMGEAIEGVRPANYAAPFQNGKPVTTPLFERTPPAPAAAKAPEASK